MSLVVLGVGLVSAPGQILKVLPQYLDRQGRAAPSPSLFDRDAYQAQLRRHPDQRSTMRFQVLWRTPPQATPPLRLLLEVQGLTHLGLPRQATIELPLQARSRRQWSSVRLDRETFQQLGDVVAWRVTLWAGSELVGEQRSFLWSGDGRANSETEPTCQP